MKTSELITAIASGAPGDIVQIDFEVDTFRWNTGRVYERKGNTVIDPAMGTDLPQTAADVVLALHRTQNLDGDVILYAFEVGWFDIASVTRPEPGIVLISAGPRF